MSEGVQFCVRHIIARVLRMNTECVRDDCTLDGNLNARWLDVFEIAGEIELLFGIAIDNDMIANWSTVADIVLTAKLLAADRRRLQGRAA